MTTTNTTSTSRLYFYVHFAGHYYTDLKVIVETTRNTEDCWTPRELLPKVEAVSMLLGHAIKAGDVIVCKHISFEKYLNGAYISGYMYDPIDGPAYSRRFRDETYTKTVEINENFCYDDIYLDADGLSPYYNNEL